MSLAADRLVMARRVLEVSALSSEMRLRAAALLARLALEGAIATTLEAHGADPYRMPFRTQLEVLRHLGELTDTSADAAFAWSALSRATHYHGYELPPTREALTGWMRLAERAIGALEDG